MSPALRIRHCRDCGAPAAYRVPDDDSRERAVCTACGTVHYQNPLAVVGTLPVWGDRVLLCRRAIEPRRGKWTLPAGFMELGETTAQGAARETDEEAGTRLARPLAARSDLHHASLVTLQILRRAHSGQRGQQDRR